MRNFIPVSLLALVLVAGLASGCKATKAFFFKEEPTGNLITRTNHVNLTNAVGVVETFTKIEQVPEVRFVPNPDVTSGVGIGAGLAGPYGNLVTVAYGGIVTALAGWMTRRKNKTVSVAENSITAVNELLRVLAQFPDGDEVVAKLKKALKAGQIKAGVWEEVDAILKRKGIPKIDLIDLLKDGGA